jgi:hypothetical protein
MRRRGHPPGPGKPIGPTRGRVVALFDAGRPVAAIVATLRISKQAVYVHLHNAGREPMQRKHEREQLRRWAKEWNAAQRIECVVKLWGVSRTKARIRANRARTRLGLKLKGFNKWDTIEALLRRGWGRERIIADGVACRSYVNWVIRSTRRK